MKLCSCFVGLLLMSFSETLPVIEWSLVNNVIVFKESVQLKCNIGRVGKFTKSIVSKWKKSTKMIVFKGQSVDKQKYEQFNEETSFTLVIKDFDLTDVNVSYTCVYGFDTDIKVLSLEDASSYELHPTSQSVTKQRFIGDGRQGFYVWFGAVFPLPICSISDDKNHSHFRRIDIFLKSTEIFLEVLVIQNDDYEILNCEDKLLLICKIGRKTHDIMTLRNEEERCRPAPQKKDCKACCITAGISVVVNIGIIIALLLTRILPKTFCMTSFCDSPISDTSKSFLEIIRVDSCRFFHRNELSTSEECENMNQTSSE